jgi:glycosyltransferase involved in cell wall biosynthesis
MKIVLLAVALPPKLDGIGDYTARLASELSNSNTVIILMSHQQQVDEIEGVRALQCFRSDDPRSNWQLVDQIRELRPDCVIVQYNPFMWGRRGFNLQLPRVVRRMKEFTRVAVMFHERYYKPVTNWKTALMAGYQRWQYRQLVSAADVCLYSTEPWLADHERSFPKKPAYHTPVGSNIPLMPGSREEARRTLGIKPDTLVLGLFGSAHVSRLLPFVRLAAEKLRAAGMDILLLHIGPDQQAISNAVPGIPLRCEGTLAPEEVSRRFRAMDVYLSPFVDGVSTRRTSFITALQHAIATVGTAGENTGPMLSSQDGEAFLLAPSDQPDGFVAAVRRAVEDVALRRQLELGAADLFRSVFAWDQIASKLLAILGDKTAAD